jgi:hypothetical protein
LRDVAARLHTFGDGADDAEPAGLADSVHIRYVGRFQGRLVPELLYRVIRCAIRYYYRVFSAHFFATKSQRHKENNKSKYISKVVVYGFLVVKSIKLGFSATILSEVEGHPALLSLPTHN